jgi:hypothetical protein
MPHLALVAFSGLRVREAELAELGMKLPGLGQRANTLRQLPSLGLLTLAGMLPDDWSSSYHEADGCRDQLLQTIVAERADLVAVSALTASAEAAYDFADRLRRENIRTVFGGLHATACPDESGLHFDAVCMGEGELVWHRVLGDAATGQLRPRYEAVRSVAAIPWPRPRFELLNRPRSRWTVQTQRGCPLACEFCAASRLISRFREKPVNGIRDELATIAELDRHPTIELADDNTFAANQDIAMWTSMGRIADRSRDILGASDVAVVEFRKLMVEAARQMQNGGPALGTAEPRIPQAKIASYQGIVPKSTDWRVLGAAAEELGDSDGGQEVKQA